jgi:fido (protein-threonine AMPylation protein)
LKKDGRYDVAGLTEAQFEPGSNEQVLKNRLGIKSPSEMDNAEARALERTMAGLVGQYDEKHRFTAADIRAIHESWLGEIYEWAGDYRQVNVSKGDFRLPPQFGFRLLWGNLKVMSWRGIRRAISVSGRMLPALWQRPTWS